MTWCSSKGIVTITQPTIYIAIVTQEQNLVKCFKELTRIITRAFLINEGWKQKNSYTGPKFLYPRSQPMIIIMCDQTIHAAICKAVQPSLPEKNQCTNELSYTLCWLEQVLYENFTPYASGCKVQSEFSMCQLSFSTGHVATPGWAEVVLVQPCGTVTGVGGHHSPIG